MYNMRSRVRFSETGADGCLSIASLVNYFQDCSTFHSESLGIGLHHLEKQHAAWLMNFWQIQVERYPELGEEIEVITIPYAFEQFYGKRNFALKDAEGNYLAKANSIWLYYDLEKRRPVRPPQSEKEAYGSEDALDMDYTQERKLKLPEQMEQLDCIQVKKTQIDVYRHVNNGQYIRMAADYLPTDQPIRELRAEYRTAAVYGDRIYPRRAVEEDWTTIALCNAEGSPYATIKVRY